MLQPPTTRKTDIFASPALHVGPARTVSPSQQTQRHQLSPVSQVANPLLDTAPFSDVRSRIGIANQGPPQHGVLGGGVGGEAGLISASSQAAESPGRSTTIDMGPGSGWSSRTPSRTNALHGSSSSYPAAPSSLDSHHHLGFSSQPRSRPFASAGSETSAPTTGGGTTASGLAGAPPPGSTLSDVRHESQYAESLSLSRTPASAKTTGYMRTPRPPSPQSAIVPHDHPSHRPHTQASRSQTGRTDATIAASADQATQRSQTLSSRLEDVAMQDDDDDDAGSKASLPRGTSSGAGSSGSGGGGGATMANAKDRWSSAAMVGGSTNTSSAAPGGGGSSSGAVGGETREAAARKQNSACDACRNRKVRCYRTPGEEKCNHCKAKGIDCTTIYVQLATSGAKRPIKRARGEGVPEGDASLALLDDIPTVVRYLLLRDGEYPDMVQGLSYAEVPGRRLPPTTAAEARLINATARQEFVSGLLETYFSTVHIRYPIIDPQEFLQRFHYGSPDLGGPPPDVLIAVLLAWGAKFSTHPIIMADRRETAHDELTPSQRLKRSIVNPLASMGTSQGTADAVQPGRLESGPESRDANRVMGRSRIAEDLIVKAQEVLDRNKAHRIASMDNAKAAIIIQALFWQQASQTEVEDATDPVELRSRKRRGVYICNGVWVNCAIAHMFEMKVHLKETVERIVDEGQRSQIAMTWWLACMFDAHMSAFYRRKPLLSAEDSSTEPPMPPSTGPEAGPSPIAIEQGYRIWLNSALEQCEMMRSVYFTLWTPRAYKDGVSARKLEKLVSLAYRWRSNHLALVGAPDPDWPSHWKFADAVTACASDINYQIIWVLMWQAIDEYGIAELKATSLAQYNQVTLRHGTSTGVPAMMAEMELDQSKVNGLRRAIYNEALKGALRCADLSRMLCDFDYLQNEAGIMKFSLCEAGYCLTRFHRPEVYKIINGLRQYGQAFEECYSQADELERLACEYCMPESMRYAVPSQSTQVAGPPFVRPDTVMNNGLPAITGIADHNRDYSYSHPGMHNFATHLMHTGPQVTSPLPHQQQELQQQQQQFSQQTGPPAYSPSAGVPGNVYGNAPYGYHGGGHAQGGGNANYF